MAASTSTRAHLQTRTAAARRARRRSSARQIVDLRTRGAVEMAAGLVGRHGGDGWLAIADARTRDRDRDDLNAVRNRAWRRRWWRAGLLGCVARYRWAG
jgi:hypothetical protein